MGERAPQQFLKNGDLTGKQPCELMHNNHNQMKKKSWSEKIQYKNGCKIKRESLSEMRGSPQFNWMAILTVIHMLLMNWGIFGI